MSSEGKISISAREVAKQTGMSVRMIQLETKAGRIPAARLCGRKYVYILDELIEYMRNLPRPGAS